VKRIFLAVLIGPALLHVAALSGADDLLTLELSARAESRQQTARGQASSLPAGTARPVLTARSAERLRIRWSAANQDKTGNIPDVTVHFFLDRENAIGERVPPKPGADVVYESALVTDLAAQGTSSADFVVEAPQAGNYLLRLETIGAARTHGHEHFAAIDLKVVP
jgi:hypothetical protein